jgi:polysaccharide biosynthesis transport protein
MSIPKEQKNPVSDYLRVILKRKWCVLAFPVVLVCAVAVLSSKVTPVYQASCQLLIEKEIAGQVGFKEVIGIDTINQDYYQTQYKILESRSLAKEVVHELGLEQVNEFSRPKPSVWSMLRKVVLNEGVVVQPRDFEAVTAMFIKAIDIEPVRNTRLLKIKAKSDNPALAAKMANTLARVYITRNLEDKLFSSRQVLKRLLPQTGEEGLSTEDDVNELILSLPSVVNHPLIQKLKEDCAGFETEYAALGRRYGPKHPKIIGVKSAFEEMKEKIDMETKRIVSSVKTELSGNLKSNNIRIIDTAEAPDKPVYPNKRMNAIMGLISGLVLGCSVAFLLEHLDNTVKSQEFIVGGLGLTFLGHIPAIRSWSGSKKRSKYIHLAEEPQSPSSEAFRNIRTWVNFQSGPHDGLKALMISSAGPQEGKTTVAVNLAISLAQAGNNVLLVDADMRRPSVHQALNLFNFKGLSDYLKKGAPMEEVLQDTYLEQLKCVCSGPLPPDTSELLGSIRMRNFIEESKKQFDCVIFDSPPALNLADAVVLGRQIDGAILVIHYGKYLKGMVDKARQRFEEMGIRIVGAVLNNIQVEKHDNTYYYYYSSDYSKSNEHKEPALT